MGKSERAIAGTPVYVNVYDLNPAGNAYTYPFGFGAYHSGIQVGSTEYSFGGHPGDSTGIYEITPRTAQEGPFRESILLGHTTKSASEIKTILQSMYSSYKGTDYNVITRNCNHFSDEFCKKLIGKGIPGWINRMANVGSYFRWALPSQGAATTTKTESTSFSAFAGTGRTLGSSGAAVTETTKTTTTTTKTTSTTKATPSNTTATTPVDDPAARRELMLRAAQARLQQQQQQQQQQQ